MPQSPQQRVSGALWTLDYVLDLLTAHLLFVSYTSLLTVVPLYVLERGGEEWQIGIVVGSFGLVSLVVRPFAGRWVYMLGAKRIAFVGLTIFSVASILYVPVPNVWLLVPVRMLQGIGMAMGPLATSVIVANLAPTTRRAEALAYLGNSISVAYLYAPVAAFWLMSYFGFAAGFLFTASSALLGALISLRISSDRIAVTTDGASPERLPLISRSSVFPTLVFLTYTLTTAPVATFLPLLAGDRQLGNPGLYYTLYSVTSIFAMSLSGLIADRAGRGAVIVPGLLLNGASMVLLTAAFNQLMFLAAGFLAGVGFGLLQPGVQSFTVDRVSPRERSSALATLQAAWDLGGSVGAFAMGPIAGALSVGATFTIVGVGSFLGATGFLVGNTRNPTPLPSERESQTVDRARS